MQAIARFGNDESGEEASECEREADRGGPIGGNEPKEPPDELKQTWLINHLHNLHVFYGEHQGVQIARKHINWQLGHKKNYYIVKPLLMQARTAAQQLETIEAYFNDCYLKSYDRAS